MVLRTRYDAYEDTEEHRGAVLTPPVSPARDHIAGVPTAALQLVEYGDYECPYCGRAYPITVAVQQAFEGRLCFVFRHFPLTAMHPNAEAAAESAEAAGAQGRFWAMHDQLFRHQDRLDSPALVEYAQAIGLDLQRFVRELADGVHVARVREDFASGVASGVSGTPTFFINGRRHEGPWDFESLSAALILAETSSAARA
jgi:NhaA family Na+:H+ antiporter